MVKARMPGSQQELYTVSVESVPQYAQNSAHRGKNHGGCCRPGRVGKDLLCGVLIALAVICAAVAIFLVVYFVAVDASPNNNEFGTETSDNNTALDSSPLTRNKEEESKPNALDDWANDPLLSSTRLPEIGIHDPDIHGHPVYPVYKTSESTAPGQKTPAIPVDEPSPVEEQPAPVEEQPAPVEEQPAPVEEKETEAEEVAPPLHEEIPAEEEAVPVEEESIPFAEETEPIVEDVIPEEEVAPVEEERPEETPEEAPVDAVAVEPQPELPSDKTPETHEQPEQPDTRIKLSDIIDQFKPILPVAAPPVDEEEVKPTEWPARETANRSEIVIDLSPWSPITVSATSNSTEEPEGRIPINVSLDPFPVISNFTVADALPTSGSNSSEEEPHSNVTDAPSIRLTSVEVTSESPDSVELIGGDSTEMPIGTDVGNLALLVRGQPNANIVNILSSRTPDTGSTEEPVRTSPGGFQPSAFPNDDQCTRRQLPFCQGVLPYPETKLPNWVGDTNEAERNLSVPYFEIIAESECHPRVEQYACAVLEPPCQSNGIALPPCRQFCRAVAEDCKSYVLTALPLASVLDCDKFPDSTDPTVCFSLATTTSDGECLPGEFHCPGDDTCIPDRWLCDGRRDCTGGEDESTCSPCNEQEFRCEAENRCVPSRWVCDGSRDCADGSDERDCHLTQDCGDGQFLCNDGLSCIPLRRVCDGSNHCRDNSDETNCTAVECQNDDFKCQESGICIPRQWVCDGNADCKDGSDETQCEASKSEVEVSGSDNSTVSTSSSSPETETNPEKCLLGELLCISDGACIRFEQLCDGTRDCSDGADETDCNSSDDFEK